MARIVVADASSCLAPEVLEGRVQELHRLPSVDLGDKAHFQALVDSPFHCSVVQTVDKVQHIRQFYRPTVDTVRKERMLLLVQVVRSSLLFLKFLKLGIHSVWWKYLLDGSLQFELR